MSRNYIVILLGLLVALTPYLGFPHKFKTFLFLIFGLSIALISYLASRERLHGHGSNDVFAENSLFDNPPQTSDEEEERRENGLSNIEQQ